MWTLATAISALSDPGPREKRLESLQAQEFGRIALMAATFWANRKHQHTAKLLATLPMAV
ncbi:hypothetical protein MCEMSEM23_03037 [Rhabdaerophilaceae bacterium]